MADEVKAPQGVLVRLPTAKEASRMAREFKLHVLLVQEQDDVSAGVASVRAYVEGPKGLEVRRRGKTS